MSVLRRSRPASPSPAPEPDSAPAAPVTAERVVRRLEWKVVRRLDGRAQGEFATLFRGAGLDVRDLREYEVGDDVRHIDWNVTARMDTPYLREHTEDRELTAWLLLDRSPSMSFGPIDRPKDVVLTELAATIARLLVRSQNRVAAVIYTDRVEQTMAPRGGRNQVLHLTRELLRPPNATPVATDLAQLLNVANSTIRRRSLVVLVSDFISEPGWERPLALLARRHEVLAIQLVDRREFELPDVGEIFVEDPETGEQLLVDTSDPGFRRRLVELVEERRAMIETAARRAGVELYEVSTEDDLVSALLRITARRRASRRYRR